MSRCGEGWSRDERRAWKREQRDNWRAQKAQLREHTARWWPPASGWTPFNIAAMVIGFIIFWPVGLAILFWNIWSAKQQRRELINAGGYALNMRWDGAPWSQTNRDLSRNSGNAVFEDYKKATLERLEEERRKLVAEQEAFATFLDDLKRARDRTEFEHFMQERESRREQDKTSPSQPSPLTPENPAPQA